MSEEAEPADVEQTVAERIRRVRNELAPAERRVVEVLVTNYPMAGLEPIAQLAAASGVSAPTVLRLLTKLGYSGYGQFRASLRQEVRARLFSPAESYPGAEPAANLLAESGRRLAESIQTTFRDLSPADVEATVAALADTGRPVLTAGGRFSAVLASHLAGYLQTLRPGVIDVPPAGRDRARALLDVDERTVAVVFDYRQYQPDTVQWGLAARARGALLVLVTDVYLSPLTPQADLVLPTAVGGPAPFDSLAAGLAVVETLTAGVAETLGDAARERLGQFEELVVAPPPEQT